MNIGDQLKPSFTLDASGIEKLNAYPIEEVSEDKVYIRTGFNILYPVHMNKIVEQDVFDADVEDNYKSKTWIHISASN